MAGVRGRRPVLGSTGRLRIFWAGHVAVCGSYFGFWVVVGGAGWLLPGVAGAVPVGGADGWVAGELAGVAAGAGADAVAGSVF